MTKKTFTTLLIVPALSLFAMPGVVSAGEWVPGCGETPTEALQNAAWLANALVISVGHGCLGRGKDGGDAVRYRGIDRDLYVFEVYRSHHDSSCRGARLPVDLILRIGESLIKTFAAGGSAPGTDPINRRGSTVKNHRVEIHPQTPECEPASDLRTLAPSRSRDDGAVRKASFAGPWTL